MSSGHCLLRRRPLSHGTMESCCCRVLFQHQNKEAVMNRRGFLAGTAAAAATAAFGREGVSEAGPSRRYRACIIGDSKQGGYGHSLHLVWALRDDVEIVGLSDLFEDRYGHALGPLRDPRAGCRDADPHHGSFRQRGGPTRTGRHHRSLSRRRPVGRQARPPPTFPTSAAAGLGLILDRRHPPGSVAFSGRGGPRPPRPAG